MSLMKALAKVAIGVAVAKGVSGMVKKGGGAPSSRGQASEGGLFGGVHSPSRQAQSGGGLEDMLGSVLGGGAGSAAKGGGLGGLLEQLSGGGTSGGASGGGLNDMLGGLAASMQKGGSGGGLGGLLGGLMGGAAASGGQAGGGFGDMLNQAIARQDEPEVAPSPDQELVAALMLSAMIQAMKSDGEIDAAEEQKLLGRLGDVSAEEQAFVQAEMRKPVDVKALAREVPRGLEQQVYAMSIMGIDLDNRKEAQYLHELATEFGLQPQTVNQIHAKMGVPQIYS